MFIQSYGNSHHCYDNTSTQAQCFGCYKIFFGWLHGFYGISTFAGYLMPNPFLYK